ncbi:hypothetical protein J7F03_02725 [Streptomyces sp. ISL-43]|uniref:hypothetical protein n=1 Tax=Streptomyces sp. ISL-43 TaxID=2819183 RepID=UPI001BE5EC44|nr:hypothetical protein [Streptomyces sp. ISL-43]MBT2446018.1 hypothetical protein [Streptomyces sp. ISL-43]
MTIGAAVVTGAVYAGLSIWDNREKIAEFGGKVADGVDRANDAIKKGAGKLADGAKNLVSKYNPFD